MFKNASKSLIYVISTIVIVGLVFGVTSLATIKAANEPSVIGVVNVTEIQNTYSAFVTAVNNINKENDRLSTELESKLKSLSNQSDKDKLTDSYNNTFNTYVINQLTPVQNNFNNAVAAVAKEKGVNVALDSSGVLYGGIDLTAAIKTKLGIK